MRHPPFQCLFCLRSDVPFHRDEPPIPESLGNDELVLPRGFVCDLCNQYFGSKIEQKIVGLPPFAIGRVRVDVPTKKGKAATFRDPEGLTLLPTGYYNQVIFIAEPKYYLGKGAFTLPYVSVSPTPREDFYTVRFLLKMGLELLLLVTQAVDPYTPVFDAARQFARYGNGSKQWEFAYGVYPHEKDLILGERYDEEGRIIQHQLYQYDLGQLFSCDISFCFIYRTHIFACNLSSPSIVEYITGFNGRNQVQLQRFAASAYGTA